MIQFIIDQNFNEDIVDGLSRRDATLQFIHVRDVGLAAAPDETVLKWAAEHASVLLTHDRKTVPRFACGAWRRACPCQAFSLSATIFPLLRPSTNCWSLLIVSPRMNVRISFAISPCERPMPKKRTNSRQSAFVALGAFRPADSRLARTVPSCWPNTSRRFRSSRFD